MGRRITLIRLIALAVISIAFLQDAVGQYVASVVPSGGQAGQTLNLTVQANGGSPNFYSATGVIISDISSTTFSSTNWTPTASNSGVANITIPPSAVPGTYYVQVPGQGGSCYCFTISPGGGGTYAEISGHVYQDLNLNCAQDVGEANIPNKIIRRGNDYAVTNNNGDYSFYATLGAHTVSNTPYGAYPTPFCPASGEYLVNLVTPGANYSGNDFGMYFNNYFDLTVAGSLQTNARPGFNTVIHPFINHYGSLSATGVTLTVDYDPTMVFVSSNPSPTTIVGNTLTWNIGTLAPGSSFNPQPTFLVPIGTAIGTVLQSTVTVSSIGDVFAPNDIKQVTRIVTGSFDPNDKQVHTDAGVNADSLIYPDDSVLHYLIRFQNTGNDTAFTVYIRDTLDPNLNPASIVVESFSHPYVMSLSGPGNIEFTFSNILLVDSLTNEPLSHGFIQYKITTLPGLADGTQIHNRASIYFDFNPAVATNQVTSTICSEITAAFNQTNSGLIYEFTDASGTAAAWAWDFGDGGTSTVQNPTHTYAAPGAYNVCLIATNSCGRPDTVCTMITAVCDPLVANFGSSVTFLDVTFSDFSAGGPTTWAWDFGDGGTSTLQNPSHTYSTASTFDVCLIIGDACGSLDTICTQVTTTCAPMSAAFTDSVSGLFIGLEDLSTGLPVSWSWDFGDGNSSSVQNPTHMYSAPGTYNVCLIVTDACVSDTTCTSITVNCLPLSAAFSDSTSGLTSFFTDNSAGQPTTWAWDFGDGNTSALQSPTHVYAGSGTFTVCLIASDPCGSDTTCTTVTTTCPVLNAGFNQTIQNLTSTFTDATVGSPISYSWDFGDGGTSTQASPVYSYAAEGTYTVCLVVEDSCSSDTLCQNITLVCPAPLSSFTLSQVAANITTTNNSSNSTTYLWDFGDGNTDTLAAPSHGYVSPGTYTVCLIASSVCGNDTSCTVVTVTCTAPVANFGYAGTGTSVAFSNYTTGNPTSRSWDFGDSNTSGAFNPTHVYAAAGVYTVCLTVSNVCDTNVFCTDINVDCPVPVASFTASGGFTSMQFSDQSTFSPTSWAWNFGDGGTSTQQNPTHAYANAGAYNVCLTSTSLCGSSNFCMTVSAAQSTENPSGFESVALWPNPSNGIFTLEGASNFSGDFVISVKNPVGEILFEQLAAKSVGAFQEELDLSALPAGLYLVELKTETGFVVLKAIRQ